jgi:hypothetical protein
MTNRVLREFVAVVASAAAAEKPADSEEPDDAQTREHIAQQGGMMPPRGT